MTATPGDPIPRRDLAMAGGTATPGGSAMPGSPAMPGGPATPAGWRWMSVGDDGLLADLPDAETVARVAGALRAALPEGVTDVVPAARTVLVRGAARRRARWAAAVRQVAEGTAPTAPGPGGAPRLVEIPVVYDGDDLADVAALAGLTPDDVVGRHAARRYRVAFGGFMPGFAYLTGLDPALVVPRLATPRTRVPAGAVAIAGEYAAVYPAATPGGWRLLGRTDAVMFDPAHDERPALLVPGDEVRFVVARQQALALPGVADEAAPAARAVGTCASPRAARKEVPDSRRRARLVDGDGGPRGGGTSGEIEVLATGPLVLVEDAGRAGLAAVGVPRSGAADPVALRAVNRLVGNRIDAAVIEVMLGGLVVRFGSTTAIALTGAPAPAELDGRPVPYGQAVRAPAGAVLELGAPVTGLRTWLAVRGGIDVAAVLGSRSTDVLSALGPAPVAPGDVLPIGRAFDGLPEAPPDPVRSCRPAAPSAPTPGEAAVGGGEDAGTSSNREVEGAAAGEGTDLEPEAAEVVVLPATAGPRFEHLDGESRGRLSRQVWTVAPDSNRVALRLDGAPLATRRGDELPSEGLLPGAVQVPHDGRLVVFGPDHPVTGGYPVVAVLTAEGIARAAQRRPGDRVRLVVRPAGDWDGDHPQLGT